MVCILFPSPASTLTNLAGENPKRCHRPRPSVMISRQARLILWLHSCCRPRCARCCAPVADLVRIWLRLRRCPAVVVVQLPSLHQNLCSCKFQPLRAVTPWLSVGKKACSFPVASTTTMPGIPERRPVDGSNACVSAPPQTR